MKGRGGNGKKLQHTVEPKLKSILLILAAKDVYDNTRRGASAISEFVLKCASSHSLVTMKKGASIDDDQHLQVLSDTMHHISLSLLQTPGSIAGFFDAEL